MRKKTRPHGQDAPANIRLKSEAEAEKSAKAGTQFFEKLVDGKSDSEKQQIIQIAARMQMRKSPYPPAGGA